MATEIERKFLVRNDSWRAHADAGTVYRQGYLTDVTAGDPARCSIRIRISGEDARINIKSAELGISRIEYEYHLPPQEAEDMLTRFALGPLVHKTRYQVQHSGFEWEVDVFAGDNAGLVVAEIELDAAEQDFPLPDWAGEEVSGDPRYYNVNLVRHPYKDW